MAQAISENEERVVMLKNSDGKITRIGIFGGSFDPPHKGHIAIASAALKKFSLNKIFFVPAFLPPHKIPKKLSSSTLRLKMLELVLRGEKNFVIDDFELIRRRKVYTYQTIERYKKKFPDAEIYFIIGADSLRELPQWKKGADLPSMAKFIVAPRSRRKIQIPPEILPRRDSICFLDMRPVDISSSEVRSKVWYAPGSKRVSRKVDQRVLDFIRKNLLYLDDAISYYLKNNLDSAKYRHTLSVAGFARRLALKTGASQTKAAVAALIHDLGRCQPVERYIDVAVRNNLIPRREIGIYKKNPFLLHSHISAHLARKIFGIKDQEILNAARNHTVMTTKDKAGIYDKIIYVSDAISGDRRFPGVDKIRRVALRGDIDKAVFMVSALKLSYVIKKKKYLAPQGVEVYNSFLP